MKNEQPVTNLELSKRLKELGVKQESLFVWCFEKINNIDSEFWSLRDWNEYGPVPKKAENIVSAFTVAELGELLPSKIKLHGERTVNLITGKIDSRWFIEYEGIAHIGVDTEANARAKMLIYLLENNLLSPKDRKEQEDENNS
jgi:hypothetical protein